MKYYSTKLFILFLILFNFYTIKESYQQEQYNFEYIGIKEGLPAGTAVDAIIQDSIGFMWFTVLGGVAKYDGYTLTFYKTFYTELDTIFYPEIHTMFMDKDNNLWLGSKDHISVYDRKKDIFKSYYLTGEEDSILFNASVYGICETQTHNLWLATAERGLFSFNKQTKKSKNYLFSENDLNSLSSNNLSSITSDNNGNLWISSYDGGICKYEIDKNIFKRYGYLKHGEFQIPSDSVHALHKDKYGNIWVAFKKKFIGKFDQGIGTFQFYSVAESRINPISVFYSICSDDDRIWIGTFRDGIILFDTTKKSFTSIKEKTPLLQNKGIRYSYSVYKDRAGIVWIGGNEVINKYSRTKQDFSFYENNETYERVLQNAVVMCIKEDNYNNLWIGTSNGIFRNNLTTKTFDHYLSNKTTKRDAATFGDNTVTGILIDNSGVLWLATYRGLCKFDTIESKSIFFTHNPKDTNSIAKGAPEFLYLDRSDNFWLTGDNTIDKFDKENQKFKHYKIPTVRSLYEDSDGILWACSGSKGLFRYNASDDSFTNYYDKESFLGFSIATEDDKNRFWAASFYSGLNLFDRQTGDYEIFDEKNGIPSNFVNNLKKDNNGFLWVSTRVGLSRFDPDSKSFKNFNENDGLKFLDFQTNSSYKSPDGKLYFGGRNGIVSFYPAPLNLNKPTVVITNFKINNIADKRDNVLLTVNTAGTNTIELDFKNNSFSFDFAALDFRDPKRNQYAFTLEGYNENWIHIGTNRTVSFTNIEPGEYTFHVKGSNDDNLWNEEGASIKLTVNPPWWRKWWFTCIWALIAVSTFGGIIRYISVQKLKRRVRELKLHQALEAERLRISKDMHDEIGSSLTRISLLSEIARKNIGDNEEINKISDASREVVNNMDEIVWAVNPKNDSLDNLAAYVSLFAQEYFDGTRISCLFEFPQCIPSLPLSSEVRHNIFLCIKEALNNVQKHSKASSVIIELTYHDKSFEFIITDNGKGFNENEINTFSNGLNNMRKRIIDIEGEYVIDSKQNEGTKVTIIIPINK